MADVQQLKILYNEFKKAKSAWLEAWRTCHKATIKLAQKDYDQAEGALLAWLEDHCEEIIEHLEG